MHIFRIIRLTEKFHLLDKRPELFGLGCGGWGGVLTVLQGIEEEELKESIHKTNVRSVNYLPDTQNKSAHCV